MRKTVSFFIIIAILASAVLAVLPVHAASPEGIAISSAEEFLSMDASGSYYLANDITLSESYASDFSGTLDGNRHTLTLDGAASAFNGIVGGNVKNLGLSVSYGLSSSADVGALARTAYGSFENISVNASYTVLSSVGAFKHALGGIIGRINGASEIKGCSSEGELRIESVISKSASIHYAVGGIAGAIKDAGSVIISDCVNRAAVSSLQYSTSNGGILGILSGNTRIVLKDCQNYGKIVGTSGTHSGTAGICGVADGTHTPSCVALFDGCRNYADISDERNGANSAATNHHLGGIVGRSYGMPSITFSECVNSGDISSVGGGWSSVGGIFGGDMTHGYDWSGDHPGVITLRGCVNTGNVRGGSYAGGLGGGVLQHSVNGCALVIDRCSNFGSAVGTSYAGGMIGNCGEEGINGIDVSACYNAGDVRAGNNAGGIIGNVKNEANNSNNQITEYLPITIDGCLNSGEITSTNSHTVKNKYAAAGILGNTTRVASITNCVNTGNAKRVRDNVLSVAHIAPEYLVTNETSGNICYSDSVLPLNSYVSHADAQTVDARAGEIISKAPADFREVEELIEKANGFEEHLVLDGWEELWLAVEQAQDVLKRPVYADSLKAAGELLKEAVDDVRVVGAPDETELKAAIKTAEQYIGSEGDYISSSFRSFRLAYLKALAVRADDAPTYLDVYSAQKELISATENLVLKADRAEMENAIDAHSSYVESDYTAKSWRSLHSALGRLEKLLGKDEVSADEANAAISALEAAADGLCVLTELSALEEKIAETEEKYQRESYTVSSYYLLRVALQEARSAIAAQLPSPERIEEIAAKIDEAVAALEQRGDTHALNEAISEIPKGDYTADSAEALEAVILEINTAVSSENIGDLSVSDVESLLGSLREAVERLKELPTDADGDEDGEEDGEEDAEATDEKPSEADEKPTESPAESPAEKPDDSSDGNSEKGCGALVTQAFSAVFFVCSALCLTLLKKRRA